jgi:hypothetical protein
VSTGAFYTLQIVSTLSVVPSIVCGLIIFVRVPLSIRLFIVFLSIGLVTDLFGWYAYLYNEGTVNQYVRYGYILTESIFYFWFVGQFLSNELIARITASAWVIIIPLWFLAICFTDGISYFMVSFQVIISFLLSFCLLKKIEIADHSLAFRLLAGSFFYYFCTFFFMSFLSTQFGLGIWYLRNIINVISNLIFFWALLTGYRKTI